MASERDDDLERRAEKLREQFRLARNVSHGYSGAWLPALNAWMSDSAERRSNQIIESIRQRGEQSSRREPGMSYAELKRLRGSGVAGPAPKPRRRRAE